MKLDYNNLDVTQEKFRFIVFGMGDDFQQFKVWINFLCRTCNLNKNFESCLECIVDNDKTKQGKFLNGKAICSPTYLKNSKEKPSVVITTSKYYKEISRQLQGMGLSKNKDYFFFKDYFSFLIENMSYDEFLRLIKERCILKKLQYQKEKNNKTLMIGNLTTSYNKNAVALFFGDGYGAVSPSLLNTVHFLSQNGYRVDLYLCKNNFCDRLGLGLRSINNENVFIYELEEILFISIDLLLEKIESRMLGESNKYHYHFCIGFDPPGLFPAAVLGETWGIPFVYHSLEFWEEEHWLKKMELICSAKALCVLAPDGKRAEKLSEMLAIEINKILIVRNSPIGKIITKKENYFRELFDIDEDKYIVLFVGSIDDVLYIREIVESSLTWPERFVLVIHGWIYNSEIREYLLEKISNNPQKIFLSTHLFANEEKYKVFCSVDIGLVFYRPINLNLKYTAASSGKLYDFMRMGIPVIANNLPGMNELVDFNGIGKVVEKFDEIEVTLNTIVDDYKIYRKNCFESYHKYEFVSIYKEVLDYIKDRIG